jgi:HD-like signal output (HDOD) protein
MGKAVILKHISDLLHQVFRSQGRSQDEEAAETAARLERKLLAFVDNMPTLPDTATRALALANDPDSKFADFARLIEADAAIATGVLHIANSPLYAGGAPVVRLQQAVVRLGMRQCQSLIVSIGIQSLFRRIAAGSQEQCEVLWQHAHVTASLCRQINRAVRLGFDGEEFSAGLLHDLGRILLLLADPECFRRADPMDFREEDQLERERAANGIDHGALGGWFGEHSALPDTLIETMRFHHKPDLTEHAKSLVALVATADHMANHLQRGEDVEAYPPADNGGLASLWARWPEARKERLLGQIPFLMMEALDMAASEQMAS